MPKGIFAALPALIVCFCMAGCGGSSAPAAENAASQNAPAADSSAAQTTKASPPESPEATANEDNSENGAQIAYRQIKVYFFDRDVQGDREAEKDTLDKKFKAAASAEGLDLAGEEPSATGDRLIYNALRREGFAEGSITLGEYDLENGEFYVFYTSPDGTAERYPTK